MSPLMFWKSVAAMGLFGLTVLSPARAQVVDAVQARNWASACANCHGTQGHAEPGMAQLAGLPQDVIVQKLQDYKAGRIPATVMQQLAKGYSDAQIQAIAAYFAAQKK